MNFCVSSSLEIERDTTEHSHSFMFILFLFERRKSGKCFCLSCVPSSMKFYRFFGFCLQVKSEKSIGWVSLKVAWQFMVEVVITTICMRRICDAMMYGWKRERALQTWVDAMSMISCCGRKMCWNVLQFLKCFSGFRNFLFPLFRRCQCSIIKQMFCSVGLTNSINSGSCKSELKLIGRISSGVFCRNWFKVVASW